MPKKDRKHSKKTSTDSRRNRKHTEATKRLVSKLHSGESNPMYGKPAANRGRPMSKKQRKLLSGIQKERFVNGAKTWNAGKHTGQHVWNSGTKGVVKGWWKGKRLSRSHRRHLSESHQGIRRSEATKQKIRNKMLEYWSFKKKNEQS